MKECKYRHEEKTTCGGEGKQITYHRYVCFGPKDAPVCYYQDVNDCDMAKPYHQTQFERICNNGPERLARAIVLLMQSAIDNPAVINYDGILAALNSEVNSDEE